MQGVITALLVFIILLFMGAVAIDYLERNLTLKTWFTGIGTIIIIYIRATI